MWLFTYILLLLSLGLNVLSDSDSSTDSSFAVELTTDNFDKALKENNHFVMFFAPWCGHCKRLHPLWEQIAELMNVNEARVVIAKVDCTVYQDLCARNEVTGYPTLKFFKLGSSDSVKFRGTRDLPTMTNFIQEQLGEKELGDADSVPLPDSSTKLVELTEDTFSKYVAQGKHFVKFYAPWCSHCQRLAPTWEELANSIEEGKDVKISKVDCTLYRPICQDFDVKGYPTLLWIEDGKKIEKYTNSRSLEGLKAYVNQRLGMESEDKHGDADSTDYDDADEDNEDGKKKSDSEGKDKHGVIHLKGDNFKKTIESGISFVKFYAPWCGHCQKLSPTWDQLAVKLQGKSGIKVAKVDCTLSENKDLCSDEQVEGYPTLFIYRNGEKLEEYNGSRQLEDLYSFASRYFEHDEL